MKIPQTFPFQDYSDDDPAIDKRLARWDFWKVLIKLKDEFSLTTDYTVDAFLEWLEQTQGIELLLDSTSGGITDDYRIVDEQKYLVFTLKYLGD
jgi:hypothetical protein